MYFLLPINSTIQTIHTLCRNNPKSMPVKPIPRKWLYIVGFVSVSLPLRMHVNRNSKCTYVPKL